MLASQYLLATQKEAPQGAELASHQLMLRAGMIRQLASGLYTWLPMGLRVLQKVEAIVRMHMNAAGALECLMPAVQPKELWEETGRWSEYDDELLRLTDRHQRAFCFGPTHEEVITDIARRELKSYKQLPVTLYQMQTKFRDERRPRFGVMRAREFMMKDAYSFSLDADGMQSCYDNMLAAYHAIFSSLGLNYRAVLADSGSIGGSVSHEFQVLAESGEDCVVFSDGSDYAANIEKATAQAPVQSALAPTQTMQTVSVTEGQSVAAVAAFLKVDIQQMVSVIVVEGHESPVALILRQDHTLNTIKAEQHPLVCAPLTVLSDVAVESIFGCNAKALGPVGLSIPYIVDRDAAVLVDFVAGAHQTDRYHTGVNWARDVALDHIADLRDVVVGDISPDGKGRLQIARGIEVGHVFQLGVKYSAAMEATVMSTDGKPVPLYMGCYGIGLSRVVAAAIEQHHDARGIIWPAAIAPFSVVIIPIKMNKSTRVRQAVQQLYDALQAQQIEVLWDDRPERPGVLFADMDLIGIPHRVVISERHLDEGVVEYKARADQESQTLAWDNLVDFLKEQCQIKR